MWKYTCAPLILALLLVAGCANVAPVPGGEQTINAAYFQSQDDFKSRVLRLQPGMGESEVLQILGRTRNDLTMLSRDEVVRVLYGANSMQTFNTVQQRDAALAYLQSLYGYHLEYKNLNKDHGFASPIRMRTTTTGYAYKLDMIFQNGRLLERPILSGGLVNDTESRTLFDYINPGTVLSRAN